MKIGIFGGTFNPIHKSHVYIARQSYQQLLLDKMLIIPNYLPPHKHTEYLASGSDRVAMCTLAFEGQKNFEIIDHEIQKGGPSYTSDTLAWLKSNCPGCELFFIMGSDIYFTMQAWKNPSEVYHMATLCVAAREDEDVAKIQEESKRLEFFGAKTQIICVTPRPMSSSEIRQKLRNGESVDDLLDPKVEAYIRERGLYVKSIKG